MSDETAKNADRLVSVGDVYAPYSRCRYGSCDKTPGHTGVHRCRCGKPVDEPGRGCFWHTLPLRNPPVEVREVWEEELIRHQPILSFTNGSVAGCQCMDRVFHRGVEDWGTHLADVMQKICSPILRERNSAHITIDMIDKMCLAEFEALEHGDFKARHLIQNIRTVIKAGEHPVGGES